jgi:hypothetical protein
MAAQFLARAAFRSGLFQHCRCQPSPLGVTLQQNNVKKICFVFDLGAVVRFWCMWQNGQEINCLFHNAKLAPSQDVLLS